MPWTRLPRARYDSGLRRGSALLGSHARRGPNRAHPSPQRQARDRHRRYREPLCKVLLFPRRRKSAPIHRAAIGLNAGTLPVRRPRKSVTGSYRPPAYRCQSAQGRFWRCPCGQCAGYATQFVMKKYYTAFQRGLPDAHGRR